MCLPVLSIFTLLAFTQAGTAWFNHDLVLLSVPQVLLLAVPLVLTLMFTFPFYPRAVVRQRWLPVVLIVVAGAAGALATLFAPASPPEAWLVFSAFPLLIGTAAVLVILAAIGTVATIWSQDDYEIVDPVRTGGESKPRRGGRPVLVAVNWIFPALALAVFAMTWGLSLLRS